MKTLGAFVAGLVVGAIGAVGGCVVIALHELQMDRFRAGTYPR